MLTNDPWLAGTTSNRILVVSQKDEFLVVRDTRGRFDLPGKNIETGQFSLVIDAIASLEMQISLSIKRYTNPSTGLLQATALHPVSMVMLNQSHDVIDEKNIEFYRVASQERRYYVKLWVCFTNRRSFRLSDEYVDEEWWSLDKLLSPEMAEISRIAIRERKLEIHKILTFRRSLQSKGK